MSAGPYHAVDLFTMGELCLWVVVLPAMWVEMGIQPALSPGIGGLILKWAFQRDQDRQHTFWE